MSSEENLLELRGQGVLPEHFMVDVHRYIYFACDYLWSKDTTPTPVLIIESFKDKKTKALIEDFGGIAYIDTIMNQKTPQDGLKELCQQLKENYKKWEVVDLCDDASALLKQNGDVKLILQQLGDTVSNIIVDAKEDIHLMGDGLEELLEYRETNPQMIAGLEVGWKKYDSITGGARPGDLIVAIARAKAGKSTLLTNWAVNLAYTSGLPILYIDTEMDSREQEDRVLSMLSGVGYQEILSGRYAKDKNKVKLIKESVATMKKGLFHHVYLPSFNIEEIKALVKKYKRQYDIQAVFFDYIKLPSSSAKGMKNAAEYQMLGFLAAALKEMSGQLQVPVFTAGQENRTDVEGTHKNAANVAGSDRILQYCTKMMFLYNKSPEDIAIAPSLGEKQLYIAYQRAGQCDAPPINIAFENECLRMKEVSL